MAISVPPYMPIQQQQRPDFDVAGSISGLGDALQQGMEFRDKRRVQRATREAFREPVLNPDGTMNFGAMAGKIAQGGGDIDTALTLTRLAETQTQNQYLRGKGQYINPGGGQPIYWGDPTGKVAPVTEGAPPEPAKPTIVPAGSTVLGPNQQPIYTAPAKPTAARGPTQEQSRQRQLLQVVSPELAILETTFADLSNPENQAGAAITPERLQNYAVSPGYQRAREALGRIAQSYLYSQSGLTAPAEEVKKLVDALMPRLGEDPTTTADKKARIQTLVDSIKGRAEEATSLDGAGAPAPQEAAPQEDEAAPTYDPETGRYYIIEADGTPAWVD